MTETEAMWLFGEFFGCYVAGWLGGYVILVIKQTFEKI